MQSWLRVVVFAALVIAALAVQDRREEARVTRLASRLEELCGNGDRPTDSPNILWRSSGNQIADSLVERLLSKLEARSAAPAPTATREEGGPDRDAGARAKVLNQEQETHLAKAKLVVDQALSVRQLTRENVMELRSIFSNQPGLAAEHEAFVGRVFKALNDGSMVAEDPAFVLF